MSVINRCPQPSQIENLSNSVNASVLDTNWQQTTNSVNDSSFVGPNGIAQDTGTANNYSVILPVGTPSSLNPGMTVSFIPANSNTGGSTLTVSPLGSAPILTPAGNALQGGEIVVNQMCTVIYNNVAPAGFRIVGWCALAFHASYAVVTNPTIECAGYTSVSIDIRMTGTATVGITLAHLADGVPVTAMFWNQRAVLSSYFLNTTTPAGVARNSTVATFATSNAGTGLSGINGPVTFSANSAIVYTGSCVNGTLWLSP